MQHLVKRLVDIAGAAAGLAVLWPLLVMLMAAVRTRLGSPVIYSQPRAGLEGRVFALHKLRTMSQARDPRGGLLPDRERLTRFGTLLRSTSLDELPQLWNVLKGEMSLVGPRPLPPGYLQRYSEVQHRRHEVKPGITGWAQVNGRNALAWERKFELDVWYVDHWSLRLDVRILWMTLLKVVRREGISRHGHATMPEFLGTREQQGSTQ